jgi:DNA-binding transcriptional LysR family regulator
VLDLHRLRLLRELHRRGTITAVGKALGFSPSAVSQQLATLERETGVRLLEQVGRRLRLTPGGELLVAHAETLLTEMERAESALAAADQDVVGTLRVAAFHSAVLALVSPVLGLLRDAHPQLRVEVSELEPEASLPALAAGELDLVVAEEYPGRPLPWDSALERTVLFRDPLVLATPVSWSARSLEDLSGLAFVMEPAGTASRQWALATCRQAGVEPDVRYTTTDLKIHLHLVADQLAAALLPELSGVRTRGEVEVHELPGRPARAVFAATRVAAAEHPGVQAFRQALAN